jgi:hypothetical protein
MPDSRAVSASMPSSVYPDVNNALSCGSVVLKQFAITWPPVGGLTKSVITMATGWLCILSLAMRELLNYTHESAEVNLNYFEGKRLRQ